MDLFLLMEYFHLSIKIYIYIYIFPVLSPISILNSPTQFLSLTLSFPSCDLLVVSHAGVCLWLLGRGFGYCYSCGYVAMYVCRCE